MEQFKNTEYASTLGNSMKFRRNMKLRANQSHSILLFYSKKRSAVRFRSAPPFVARIQAVSVTSPTVENGQSAWGSNREAAAINGGLISPCVSGSYLGFDRRFAGADRARWRRLHRRNRHAALKPLQTAGGEVHKVLHGRTFAEPKRSARPYGANRPGRTR